MQLPIKAHYALLAMLSLADRHSQNEQLAARVIAKENAIPSQFLGQILQQLRTSGLITSLRGPQGGFKLNASPEKVSVADIVEAVCPLSVPIESDEGAAEGFAGVAWQLWAELSDLQIQYLRRISLDELVARKAEMQGTAMFYI